MLRKDRRTGGRTDGQTKAISIIPQPLRGGGSKRWAEDFDGVLNRPPSISDETINKLPQVECNPLFFEFPTAPETVKAIKLLSSGKAVGSDAIPAKIYKAEGPPIAENLQELF